LVWIGAQSLKRVFAAIAEEVGTDEKTVRNTFRDYIRELEKSTTFATPHSLGSMRYTSSGPRCVLTNVQERTIIDLLSDRSKVAVSQRLFAFRDKNYIRLVTMDMWRPYRDAVRAILPKATVVVDKFDVLRTANDGIEQLRNWLSRCSGAK
jgi:transposase